MSKTKFIDFFLVFHELEFSTEKITTKRIQNYSQPIFLQTFSVKLNPMQWNTITMQYKSCDSLDPGGPRLIFKKIQNFQSKDLDNVFQRFGKCNRRIKLTKNY